MTDYREVRTTKQESGQKQRLATYKATQMIWLLLGILEAAIGLRVVFKLIGGKCSQPIRCSPIQPDRPFRSSICKFNGNPISWQHGVGNFCTHCNDRVPAIRLGSLQDCAFDFLPPAGSRERQAVGCFRAHPPASFHRHPSNNCHRKHEFPNTIRVLVIGMRY